MTKARDLANIISGGFDATDIPNLDTAKITSGTFVDARLPATALNSNVDLTTLSASNLTSGTVATARLGSGTASSSTFLRGDNTFAEAGGGKILQVLSTTKTARQSTTSTSPVDISDMSIAITPSATSSKIFCTAFFGAIGVNGYQSYANLVRGSTSILLGDSAGSTQRCTITFGGDAGSTTSSFGGFAMSFLDSPNTTSSTTYKMQFFVRSGGTFEIGGTQNQTLSYFASAPSTFTVMEVGA